MAPAPAAAASRRCTRCRRYQSRRTVVAERHQRQLLGHAVRGRQRRRTAARSPTSRRTPTPTRATSSTTTGAGPASAAPAPPRRCGPRSRHSSTPRAHAAASAIGFANPALYDGRGVRLLVGLPRHHLGQQRLHTGRLQRRALSRPAPATTWRRGSARRTAATLPAALCGDGNPPNTVTVTNPGSQTTTVGPRSACRSRPPTRGAPP